MLKMQKVPIVGGGTPSHRSGALRPRDDDAKRRRILDSDFFILKSWQVCILSRKCNTI